MVIFLYVIIHDIKNQFVFVLFFLIFFTSSAPNPICIAAIVSRFCPNKQTKILFLQKFQLRNIFHNQDAILNMGDNFGIHRGGARANGNTNTTTTSASASSSSEDRTQGQILSDFLLQLEDYTPTVSTLDYVSYKVLLKYFHINLRFRTL